jgi:pSer/pThr/pTyr-binding forkhead associated (FHA) protein
MKLSLVVLTAGKSEGKAIPITLSQFLIGHDPQCHLRPASALINKRHCAVLTRGEQVFLRDFDSTNGTFLNEQPVKGEVELHDNDELKVGPLLFRVRLETASVPVNEPTPVPPTKVPAAAKRAPTRKTPLPPTKAPAPAPEKETAPVKETVAARDTGGESDEDIVAMLLSLQDGDDSPGDYSPGKPTESDMELVLVPAPPGEGPEEHQCKVLWEMLQSNHVDKTYPSSEYGSLIAELRNPHSPCREILAEGFHRLVLLDIERGCNERGEFDLSTFLAYAVEQLVAAFGLDLATLPAPEDIFQILSDEPRSLFAFLNAQRATRESLFRLRAFTQNRHHVLMLSRGEPETSSAAREILEKYMRRPRA